jgi:hypothetical protein
MDALTQFKHSIKMAEELMKIERSSYKNPPRLSEQNAVMGLRGGIAILSVAAFENYLKNLIEEQISQLSFANLDFNKLPDNIKVNSIFNKLESALSGPKFQDPTPKVDRIPDIMNACTKVIANLIDPIVFCDVSSNPNSKNVKVLFKNIELRNIFTVIKPTFDKKWKQPTANMFIESKLDEIVNRRHIVAHTADALNITRSDLNEGIKFLKIISESLNVEIKKHMKSLVASCK